MGKHYLLYGSERYALGILRPLQRAIRARGDETAWFFDGPGGDDLAGDERRLRTVGEVRQFAPLAVFAPGNHIPHFFPGVKVEIFHGFDAGKPRHIYIRGFFDMYCTTGPRDTRKFEALERKLGHFAVRETGWPKLDPFGSRESERIADRPVVLYHSTFSPSWSAAERLHDTIRELSRDPCWLWRVTFHPKMSPDTVRKYKKIQGANLEFTEVDNILELYPGADVMVSDTSSALTEFLLWHKPVVTFRNRRPEPCLIDIDDPRRLKPSIERALSRPPELMQTIRNHTREVHPYSDGKSSERVLAAVDAFIAAGARNRRRKPLNLWRKLKLRRRLGYYGP